MKNTMVGRTKALKDKDIDRIFERRGCFMKSHEWVNFHPEL